MCISINFLSPNRDMLSMNFHAKWSLLLLVTSLVVGCESSTPTPAAEQDEVEKWVSDNPAPPPAPVDGEKF